MNTDASMKFSVSERVAWDERDDTVYAVLATDSVPLALTGSAAVLWSRVAESAVTAEELISELAEDYEADPAVIQADVMPMLEDLSSRGYLVAAQPEAPTAE